MKSYESYSSPEIRPPDAESFGGAHREHDDLEDAVARPPERVVAREEEWDEELKEAVRPAPHPAEPPDRAPVAELDELVAPVPHRHGGPGIGDHLSSPEVSGSGESVAPQRFPHGETDDVPRALGALALKSTVDVLDEPGARQLGAVAVGAVVNDGTTTALTATSDDQDTDETDER